MVAIVLVWPVHVFGCALRYSVIESSFKVANFLSRHPRWRGDGGNRTHQAELARVRGPSVDGTDTTIVSNGRP
jgi:hypothetical protein